MKAVTFSLLSVAVTALVLATLGIDSCGGTDDDDTVVDLQWYYTCGDPVCAGYTPQEGVELCTDEQAGDPCTEDGAMCDPQDDCNRKLVCSSEDPTQQDGGCPISRAEYKRDITYLSDGDLTRYHNELLKMRLATWQYKNASAETPHRLGFIIDDNENSPAVLPSKERVDVYGYTSMTVAAVQHQAKQLEALEQEVAKLSKALENSKKEGCRE